MEEIYQKVADELGIPYAKVKKLYSAYWGAIKKIVSTTLLIDTDFTEEEFKALRPNVELIYLGKLYCPYKWYRERLSYVKKTKSDDIKEDQTII